MTQVAEELGIYRQALRACEMGACGGPGPKKRPPKAFALGKAVIPFADKA